MTTTLERLVEQAGLTGSIGLTRGGSVAVSGVAYDSRAIKGGEIFVAVKGVNHDGVTFTDEARSRGATAVVAQEEPPADWPLPWVRVDDAREALARLAAAYYGDPSRELLVVGTTGTNGKTTTTYLVEAVLREAGIPCGRVSSVSYRIRDDVHEAGRTTPEAPDLQRMMRAMVDSGSGGCVLEVSSHALELKRTEGVEFNAAVFTNLTRDHLDFHGDMTRYFAAKRRLFDALDSRSPAVINVDDEFGRQLVASVSRPVTFGLDAKADVRPERIELSHDGMMLDVRTPRGALSLRSSLLGRTNAYNVVAAAAVGAALALPFRAIERGLASVDRVPGRMEIVSEASDDVRVIVDFAHTDDAMKGLLETARPLASGRLITVFGCGGDRDRTKRPLMGTVAARLSDLVVVTSDNPRSEDPAAIARDVERGLISGETEWVTVLDRAEAIGFAVREAQPGDLVVLAGKGHERYQTVGGRTVPFEDAAVARQALAQRRTESRVG